MHPVSGVVEGHHPCVAKVGDPAVVLRVRGPAFAAVEEQDRAGDAAPQFGDLGRRHLVGRLGAHVIAEFPAVAAILVLVDAVLGQVQRLLGRQVPIGFLHPREGVFERGIAARQAAGQGAFFVDPAPHALGDRALAPRPHAARQGAEALDGDEPADRNGVDPGIAQRDHGVTP